MALPRCLPSFVRVATHSQWTPPRPQVVVCNCLTMMLDTPFLDKSIVVDDRNDDDLLAVLGALDIMFTLIFTVSRARSRPRSLTTSSVPHDNPALLEPAGLTARWDAVGADCSLKTSPVTRVGLGSRRAGVSLVQAEAALRSIAWGFWFGPCPYLGDGWNRMDFFIVVRIVERQWKGSENAVVRQC